MCELVFLFARKFPRNTRNDPFREIHRSSFTAAELRGLNPKEIICYDPDNEVEESVRPGSVVITLEASFMEVVQDGNMLVFSSTLAPDLEKITPVELLAEYDDLRYSGPCGGWGRPHEH
jgi:hypothetical protein